MTPEQIAKLPKWAQHEITVMQMHLTHAESELKRIRTNPESNTFTGFEVSDNKQFLKNNAHITFVLPQGKISAYITKEGIVDINANSGAMFCITPRASNACELKFIAK